MIGPVEGYRRDDSHGWLPHDVDSEEIEAGVRRLRVHAPGAAAVALWLPCRLDEHFAGLGEQFTQVDKRGRVFDGFVGASVNAAARFTHGLDGGYKVAPLWYSSAGYAAFVSGTRRVRIEFAVRDPHRVVVEMPDESLELFVVDGTPAESIEVVTRLTGRAPLAPPWAYGVWKGCRGGHDAVLAEAQRLRDEQVGASAVWLDAHYEPDTNSGFPCAGTYPLGDYPDIAKTVGGLHDLGLHALTYLNPYLYRHTPAGEEAVRRGYAVADADGRPLYEPMLHPTHGDDFGILSSTGFHSLDEAAAIVDFTNPEARAWWQGLLRRILLDEGFDGWMSDFGEGVPEQARMHDGTSADVAHNRYPLLYQDAIVEEVRRTKPGAVSFSRGGWLGAQALSPAFWPGDQTRDWSAECGIASVVAAGISLGLMGVAAWGPDIGGNMGYPGLGQGYGGGSDDKELWLRWCQLGAMTPVMRDHLSFHSGTPVDLWTDADTVDCWRRCADWHIRLFPYLWSAAHETSARGMPVLRGLMLEFPDDPESWVLTSQYLLGDALLCAPVLEKGARSRRVYLPDGAWTDIWTGERYDGRGWVDIAAPLDRWPVLQRVGVPVAMLAQPRLDLNDPGLADGLFDLEIRVEPGPGAPTIRRLFDGTRIEVGAEEVTVTSPRARGCSLATATGRVVARGHGESVRLRAESPSEG